MPVEISLKEWADQNDVPYRTAQQWAKDGVIVAKKKKLPVKLTLNRLVKTYVVSSDTKCPE